MSYILNILICIGMILLDSLLKYFMFNVVIDLSSTFDNTVVLIYNLLFMFIIYLWIKIKLKVLIFSTRTITTLESVNVCGCPVVAASRGPLCSAASSSVTCSDGEVLLR
jgi:hypothetical protein